MFRLTTNRIFVLLFTISSLYLLSEGQYVLGLIMAATAIVIWRFT